MIARTVIVIASLMLSTTALAKDEPPKDGKKKSDLVCRNFPTTGSLIGSRRVCKTPAEWRNERDRIQDMSETTTCAGSGRQCDG